MTDMTESTELLAFKRQKDGYKVTVKISLCICVVLSWDELKVRQNLLDSDYEIYMVRLLVATVNWHKSLQFASYPFIFHFQLPGALDGTLEKKFQYFLLVMIF